MKLFWGCLVWVVGILVAAIAGLEPVFCLGLMLVCCVLIFRLKSNQKAAAIFCSVLAAGMLRYTLYPTGPARDNIAQLNGTIRATIEGTICEEPDRRSTHSQLVISVDRVRINETWQPANGQILAKSPIYPRFEYGDRVSVRGSIQEPANDEGFSYKQYLADRGIYSIVSGDIIKLDDQPGLYRSLLRIKQSLRTTIEQLLPDPESGLLIGIVLGIDHTLPEYLQEAFQRTGLSHIIVISGFNISLIAQAMILISQRLGRKLGLWLSLLGILVFSLFVGWSPPVTRAAIMGALTILASLSGRKAHTATSLAIATLVMTCISPRILWNVSFQLSLAASAGLIFVEPAIAERLDTIRSDHILRELVLTTFAAQLFTLPIAWYHFGELSLIALPANILVLWAQPLILILGTCSAFLGILWLPLGQIASGLLWPLLRYTNIVVRVLGEIDWALLKVPPARGWMVWLFYAITLVLIWLWPPRTEPRNTNKQKSFDIPSWVRVMTLSVIMIVAVTSRLPDGNTHVYFYDVGQGDAALIVSPGGRTILIDGGADPSLLAARIGETLPFWQRTIDCVIATHADGDHLTGLVPLAERYHIGLALESLVMRETALVTRWHEALENQGVRLEIARGGQIVKVGTSLSLSVIHPSLNTATPGLDENRYSVVSMLESDSGVKTLFTADMDAIAETMLLSQAIPVDADILKVAHHGASSATTPAFVAAVSPEIAVISVGQGNHYGHPAQYCVDALAENNTLVLRTDYKGTVEIVIPSQVQKEEPDMASL